MSRIGFISYSLDTGLTGIGRYMIQLMRALAAEGVDVVLLATERHDNYGLWDEFETHRLRGCRLAPQLLSWGNLAVSAASRSYRLDILHDPNGIAPFLGPSLSARRVVTIHDAFAYVHPETHNRLDNWRYHWILPSMARRADAVITVSEYSRRDLVRFLGLQPARVSVTSEGVDMRFRPCDDVLQAETLQARYGIGQPYLLYVGGINARKNIARLLEAFAQVRERHPELRLVIAGKRQWATGEIDATFQRLRLEDSVQWTGYVRDEELPSLYSGAAALAFPSLYEGFGLPVLEAMACGTPVITSNVSSLPEVAGDAALLVDPYDVSAIAGAIAQILEQPALAAQLRERGLARARQFTWQRVARQTIAVYEQVLSARPDAKELPNEY